MGYLQSLTRVQGFPMQTNAGFLQALVFCFYRTKEGNNHRDRNQLQSRDICYRVWVHKHVNSVCAIALTAMGGRQTVYTSGLMHILMLAEAKTGVAIGIPIASCFERAQVKYR